MDDKKFWSFAIVIVVSLTCVGSGLFSSLSGPTLLYLTENVDSSVDSVSYVFTGRAAGYLVGSVFCGFLIRGYKKYKPMLTVGIGVILSGVLMFITPWIYSLAGLVVASSITGMLFGYMESGSQSMYLMLWGEKDSRPYLQSFHFAFGIGAVLAPVIAAPFLEMADAQGDTDDSCPQQTTITTTMSMITTTTYNTTEHDSGTVDGFNPVGWTYVMSGGFTMITGAIMVVLALTGAENKVKSKTTEEESDEKEIDEIKTLKKEEPIKDVVWLFLPVMFYYFIIVCLELLYQSYIYSIALCSDLAFSISDSAMLNTLFWIGFMVGRGSGIFVASVFEPKTMILYSLVGTNIGLIILAIFGETISLIIWFVSFFHGFCVAWFYSSGISWISQITNVSSTYIFIFALGNTVGSMAMPAVAGELFVMDPYNVVYLLLSLALVNIFVVFWMFYMGRRHQKHTETSEIFKNNITKTSSTRL